MSSSLSLSPSLSVYGGGSLGLAKETDEIWPQLGREILGGLRGRFWGGFRRYLAHVRIYVPILIVLTVDSSALVLSPTILL
jgi:hypothetical protein